MNKRIETLQTYQERGRIAVIDATNVLAFAKENGETGMELARMAGNLIDAAKTHAQATVTLVAAIHEALANAELDGAAQAELALAMVGR